MSSVPARRLLRDYGIAVAAAVVIALFIRVFFVEAYRIPSGAMRPTLEPGDTIFVAKWPFGSSGLTQGRLPLRGEVVVFSPPWDPDRDYIKRVVAAAGDDVSIRQGRLRVNDKDVAVSVPRQAVCGTEQLPGAAYDVCWEPPLMDDFGPERIPEGSVFVLGDLRTRDDATRQKAWGTIPVSAVKGKALWIWLSIDPPGQSGRSWFSRIRFERMLRTI